jgi:hypothetical protein
VRDRFKIRHLCERVKTERETSAKSRRTLSLGHVKQKQHHDQLEEEWNAFFASDLIDGPIATWFAQDLTGELSAEIDTKNEEADYLSPRWSQCYYKFCASLGAEVRSNYNGQLLIDQHNNDDAADVTSAGGGGRQ